MEDEYWDHPCKPMLTQTFREIPTFIQAATIPSAMPQQGQSVFSSQNDYKDISSLDVKNKILLPAASSAMAQQQGQFAFLNQNDYKDISATSSNAKDIKSDLRVNSEKGKSLQKSGFQTGISIKKLEEKRFQCTFCAYRCKHEISLVGHLSKLHPDTEGPPDLEEINKTDSENVKLTCTLCDYTCISKIVLQYHNESKHQTAEASSSSKKVEKEYRCVHCAFTAHHQASYKRHLETRHPGKSGSHDCNKCNYTTFSYMKFINHLTIDNHKVVCTQDTSM